MERKQHLEHRRGLLGGRRGDAREVAAERKLREKAAYRLELEQPEVVVHGQLGKNQRVGGVPQGVALLVEDGHAEHVFLLGAFQHGGEQVGRPGRRGVALGELPLGHGEQDRGVAVDDRLADFPAKLGAEKHDHGGEDGHEQAPGEDCQDRRAPESLIHLAVG